MENHGNRVTIRPTTCKDLLVLMGLWNDGRVMRWVGKPDGLAYGADDVFAWYHKMQADPSRHHFVVHAPEVGFCGELYYAVDNLHRRASLDIKFRPEAQGHGLATESFAWLIRRVFECEPDVDIAWTEPSSDNSRAHKLYARCGFSAQPRPIDLWQADSFWAITRDEWQRGEVAHTL